MAKQRQAPSNIGYELFIGALSLLSIVNLLLLFFEPPNSSMTYVIYVMNTIMFPIFLGDFFYRFFFRYKNTKSDYFFRNFGWADLISSLPLAQVKILRLFRLWRVIRLFRDFGPKQLFKEFVEHRAENALLSVGFLVLLLIEWGSITVLRAESSSPDANITTAADAIWWVYVTITTVGYGDHYPVTNWGRIIGMIVMTAGVGLFGTLSGYLANQFLSNPEPKAETSTAAPSDPEVRIAEIAELIDSQEKATADLKTKLAELNMLLKDSGRIA